MSIISDFINRIRNKRLPEAQNMPQYNYDDVMNYMEGSGLLQKYFVEMDKINYEQDKYYPSKVHGIDHTSRVTLFATILSDFDRLDDHTKGLLLAAVRYHDIGRIDDTESKEHGKYGADKVIQEDLLGEFSKEDKKLINFVIEQHSLSGEENEKNLKSIPFWKRKQYSTVLSYLKDADALDRVRIANKNAQLDPSRLRNHSSKSLVDFAYENYNNFDKLIKKYNKDRLSKDDLVFEKYFDLVTNSIIDVKWLIQNKELLKDLDSRGVLQNCVEHNIHFIDILEDEQFVRATTQVKYGDFEYIRENGYNITYDSFLKIVGSYQEGTLEKLRSEEKLSEIFSYETFQKYGIRDNFNSRLRNDNISDKELLDKLNRKATTKLLEETFKQDYMLYKNLYENNKDGFGILENHFPDQDIKNMYGIFERIDINDLKILRNSGYKISLDDLIEISSRFYPEEYRDIISSGNISKLFEYNPEKDRDITGETYEENFLKLKKQNPQITEEDFKANYVLYKDILRINLDIFSNNELKKYSVKEIYPIVTKLEDACRRLCTFKNINFNYDEKSIIDLLEFSKKVEILNFENSKDEDELIKGIVENENLKNDPRFIEYITKKNKVFFIEDLSDVLNYNKFCMKKILTNPDISIEEAKTSLLNSFINIECPREEYRQEIEQNIINELYYYEKYKEQGDLENKEPTIEEQKMDENINDLIKIMDAQTIEELKDKLHNLYSQENNYNYDTIMDVVNDSLSELSKDDIVRELNKTKKMLDNSPTLNMQVGQEMVPIKYLNGQDFTLDVTTVMPYCSSVSKNRFNMDEELIKENMLNRPLNPNNRCTTLINQDNIAHAKSALEGEELLYAYIPMSEENVSITGTHDLSTGIVDDNGKKVRVTSRATQNRKCEDIIHGTTEEHNEAVLNGVYPRYIVCFDKVSEVAIQKYKMLKEQYQNEKIGHDIEILFIEGKNKYIPQINAQLENNMNSINEEIESTGKISEETLDRFFNKRQRNLVLETVQSINSTSYRDELWDVSKNSQKLDKLTDILEKVGELAPLEYVGELISQVDFILDRSNESNSINSSRFYDHSYKNSIKVQKVKEIRRKIEDRLDTNDQKQNDIIKTQVKDR